MNGAQPQQRRGVGCLPLLLLLGGAAIGYGAYQMSGWSYLDGGGKAFAVIMVVLGTLMLLPALVMIIILIVAKTMLSRLQRQIQQVGDDFAKATEEAAGTIVDESRAMYSQIHEFRDATDADFAGLDLGYYQRMSEHLIQAGYRHLGDVVDATIEQISHASPPIRVFSSPDGTTTVACYHIKPPEGSDFGGGQSLLMCDVTCEFSDGTYLATSNTQGLDALAAPTQITKRQFPLATPTDELIRSHEAEKARLLAAKPGVTCVIISTLADAIESEKRQQAAKNTHRKEVGFIEAEEVREVARNHNVDEGLANDIANATDEVRKRDQSP